jgi:hypothetical protein
VGRSLWEYHQQLVSSAQSWRLCRVLTVQVFVFTFLLFLSGYVLQQQTVRSIQAVLKPPVASPVEIEQIKTKPKTITSLRSDTSRPSVNWDHLAYVQLVKEPTAVCEVLILFAELQRQGSLADRVLLYPRSWDESERENSIPASRIHMATARRLLKTAAARYDVRVHPIDPMVEDADRMSPVPFQHTLKAEADFHYLALNSTSYPLASLLSLTRYNTVLTLNTPSLILHAKPLDSVLVKAPASPVSFSEAPATSNSEVNSNIFVFHPSLSASNRVSEALASENTLAELDLLQYLYSPPESLLPSSVFSSQSLLSTSAFKDLEVDLTEAVQDAATVIFDDEGLRGPAFDVPQALWNQARPGGQAGRLWEGLWERYREERRGVCGLDLDIWVNHEP